MTPVVSYDSYACSGELEKGLLYSVIFEFERAFSETVTETDA
jgi:hypothetical protein